mmetsp:Transcript_54772/g.155828  ORF Transcript_54772/g.155828 Transcript_54772/m.155828 type:complete len:339 (+) Transcript_54772:912-1928(+)
MAWIVASMKPRFTMSSRYWAFRLRPRTIPRAAWCRGAWSRFACSTAASEESHPEARMAFCTSPQSAEHVHNAEATLARVVVVTELSKAAIRASTPPLCRTVRQQSSLTAKLLRKRQMAMMREVWRMHLFSRSTSTVMPPLCARARLWRVRFAISASAVIASSSTAGPSRCFRSRSTTAATEPSLLMIVSELSTTLNVARTSRQCLIMMPSPEWRFSRSVVVDSRPFWMAMLSLGWSWPRSLASSFMVRRRQPSSEKSSCARSQEQSAETSLCSAPASSCGRSSSSASAACRGPASCEAGASFCVWDCSNTETRVAIVSAIGLPAPPSMHGRMVPQANG